ncbi:transmembrane amino acid transporter [Ceratocystis lukuohia]|uniref:Transmembrane amino acid transporter n=1 Tax=Ceratocystis lukuohia TaxID=2019550 RepID=A0ABR4MG01_9PEZI
MTSSNSLPHDHDHDHDRSGAFLSSSYASRWTDGADANGDIEGNAGESTSLLAGHGQRQRRFVVMPLFFQYTIPNPWPFFFISQYSSSTTNRLAALTDIGGVNSIRSFTRSWQRAAGFQEVIPRRPSFQFAPDYAPEVGALDYDHSAIEDGPQPHTAAPGLLGAQIRSGSLPDGTTNANAGTPPPSGGDFRERERKALEDELAGALAGRSPGGSGHQRSSFSSSSDMRMGSLFAVPPHLADPLVGSYQSYHSYGSVNSILTDRSGIARAWQQQQQQQQQQGSDGTAEHREIPPILVREVEQDGKIVLAVEGQSTLPQTIFNSINVLIGVGLLSLPMGVRYAGWICGMILLAAAALVCSYTAKLLAKCMDLDQSIITFSDLAYISFGSKARIATSILFTLELLAACVALNSLELLIPGFMSSVQWKIVCCVLIAPLNFVPLRLLSFTSVIGIFCCLCIVSIVVFDGLYKPDFPGSLLEPAATYLFPEHWSTLPLSFGLLLSPWGGHSVFPNIYRDMRHPYKYARAVKTTFLFTYLLDATTAVAGLLMFGDGVAEEITSNILRTSGYPRVLTLMMCAFIGIIPLTKIPLNARPIVNTLEVVFGVNDPAMQISPHTRSMMRVFIKLLVIVIFLAISIIFPAFDSIMAFMGSGLCFSICIMQVDVSFPH